MYVTSEFLRWRKWLRILREKDRAFPFRKEDFVELSDFFSDFFDFHEILSVNSFFSLFFFSTGELELKGRGGSSSSNSSAPPRDRKPVLGFFKPANVCRRAPLRPKYKTIYRMIESTNVLKLNALPIESPLLQDNT
ncbi:MAG: hypothetical protein ACK518_01475 [bacterium]